MKTNDVVRAWGRILSGHYPSLSIEITRECPLRCPGCYAYEPEHLGQLGPLRTLSDYKGEELIAGVLALVRKHRPLHISIVGGGKSFVVNSPANLTNFLFDLMMIHRCSTVTVSRIAAL